MKLLDIDIRKETREIKDIIRLAVVWNMMNIVDRDFRKGEKLAKELRAKLENDLRQIDTYIEQVRPND